MPKLRPTPKQKRLELLQSWQRFCGVSNEIAGACIGVSESTYARRMKDGRFEIDQLLKLVDIFRVPPADAITILCGGSNTMDRWRERNAKALRIDAETQ